MLEEQRKITARLSELAESDKTRVRDLNTSALSRVIGINMRKDHQKAISPFVPRVKQTDLPKEFSREVKVTSLEEARTKQGLTALALLAIAPTHHDLDESSNSNKSTKGTTMGKLELSLLVFNGKCLDLYAQDFICYLRMRG